MSIVVIGLLGIATSIVTEVVTWLNAKFNGTLLQGKAAFIVTLVVSLIGGAFKVGFSHITDWSSLLTAFSQVFAVSQVYFALVAKTLGLEVTPGSAVLSRG